MLKILIVKSSALGDIVQAFPILSYLKAIDPHCEVDWVVEESCKDLIASHPLVNEVIVMNGKRWKEDFYKPFFSFCKKLKEKKYDLLFDLQGNCKSALVVWVAKAKIKVGRGRKSVREWPNLLVTNRRYEMPKKKSIQEQYLSIVEQYFQKKIPIDTECLLNIPSSERKIVDQYIKSLSSSKKKALICCGSNWENKRIRSENLSQFLQEIEKNYEVEFLLAWGNPQEKREAELLQKKLHKAHLLPKLFFSSLQYLMQKVDFLIGVDSSLIHLCGTTSTPTFGLFGPTLKNVFQPIGANQGGFQGKCPYQMQFDKQCPKLRSCPTGACLHDISVTILFKKFTEWFEKIEYNNTDCKEKLTILNKK